MQVSASPGEVRVVTIGEGGRRRAHVGVSLGEDVGMGVNIGWQEAWK